MIDGMALVAMLVRSGAPEVVDPEGVGRRGCAIVLRSEEREPETTEDEGVGRSGCATVRSVAVCMTKGANKTGGGISAAGSSEM